MDAVQSRPTPQGTHNRPVPGSNRRQGLRSSLSHRLDELLTRLVVGHQLDHIEVQVSQREVEADLCCGRDD